MTLISRILFAGFFALVYNSYAQTNSWESAAKIASESEEILTSVKTVQDGFVVSGVISGDTSKVLTPQDLLQNGNTLDRYGGESDVFVAKYNLSSELQWYFIIGTVNADTAHIEVDREGRIYVYGSFTSLLNCGGRGLRTNLGAPGVAKSYILQYNSNGEYEKSFAQDDNMRIVSVDASLEDTVLVTGHFTGTILPGNHTLQNTTEAENPFFLALNANDLNEVYWSNGLKSVEGISVRKTVYSNGKLFISGNSAGTNYKDYSYGFNYNGSQGFFVGSVLTQNGSVQWVKAYNLEPSGSDTEISGFASNSNNLFLQLNTIDSVYISEEDLVSVSRSDYESSFTIKINRLNGNLEAIKQLKSTNNLDIADVEIFEENLYLLGSFKEVLSSEDFYETSENNIEFFVLKLNTQMEYWFLKTAGQKGTDIFPVDLDIYNTDHYYVGGMFTKRIRFDDIDIGYAPSNTNKIFVAEASGIVPEIIDVVNLQDDKYCFYYNTENEYVLDVLTNDLGIGNGQLSIESQPGTGTVSLSDNQIVYVPSGTGDYQTSFTYSVSGIVGEAEVIILMNRPRINLSDTTICTDNDVVNLYSIFNFSSDTVEFFQEDILISDIDFQNQNSHKIEVSSYSEVCTESKFIDITRAIPLQENLDSSITICSDTLNISRLVEVYGQPYFSGQTQITYDNHEHNLVLPGGGNYEISFQKNNSECIKEVLRFRITSITASNRTKTNYSYILYPQEEVELNSLMFQDGDKEWVVLKGDALLLDTNNVTARFQMQKENSVIKTKIYMGNCLVGEEYFMLDKKRFNFPNAFSPNGDGLNDAFLVNGTEQIDKKSFQVYDPNGNKVYENSQYNNDWDGKDANGKVLPEDVYFYNYVILGKSYKGSVEIKR